MHCSNLPWSGVSLYRSVFHLVYGVEPDYTREGGSIPVVLTLANTTGKNVLLLSMGRSDDGAHSQNEKLNISNFQKGVRDQVDEVVYVYILLHLFLRLIVQAEKLTLKQIAMRSKL